MPRYKLKKDHYLQDKAAKLEPQAHEAGAEIDWNGTPSLHMEPLDTEAKERVEARVADFQATRKRAQNARKTVGWSPRYEQNMVNIVTRGATLPDAPPQAAAGSGRKQRKAA